MIFYSIVSSVSFLLIRRLQFFIAISIYTSFALMPNPPVEQATSDKYLHFLGNILLYGSTSVAWMDKRINLLALLVPFCLFVEGLQALTPSRTLDVKDMFANVLGLMAGFAVVQMCSCLVQKWTGLSLHQLLQQKR